MGWFSFNFSKHQETQADIILNAPISGTIIPIEDVPDVVFSEKIIGEGIAIKPTGDKVVAPCDCTVMEIFSTNHAIVLKTTPFDLTLFIHIGIDTVDLKGEGFKRIAEEGDTVKAGETLIEFNLNYIQSHAKSTVTPVLISSTDQPRIAKLEKLTGQCTEGQTQILKINLKDKPVKKD
ncbi:MAG: glucose PTS transporter subunit IIA [Succinivibrionaceae bacterium]|nr:glucose PTS transporter subunit IIA [Succinivibrionaceae bacterium]MEE1340220.1 glucose PTS transporter subunit IIA [Succinivibrionaceae bacterium]